MGTNRVQIDGVEKIWKSKSGGGGAGETQVSKSPGRLDLGNTKPITQSTSSVNCKSGDILKPIVALQLSHEKLFNLHK